MEMVTSEGHMSLLKGNSIVLRSKVELLIISKVIKTLSVEVIFWCFL